VYGKILSSIEEITSFQTENRTFSQDYARPDTKIENISILEKTKK